MTLAIAHRTTRPGERVIVDAVREVRPPFSPSAVVDDFAALRGHLSFSDSHFIYACVALREG